MGSYRKTGAAPLVLKEKKVSWTWLGRAPLTIHAVTPTNSRISHR